MKVLHALDVSAPVIASYAARTRSILARQSEIGVAPVAVTGLSQGSTGALREEIDGVGHYRTRPIARGRGNRVATLREALEMTALGRRIAEVARAESPDVIHGHSPILCGLPAHAVARSIGAASVYEIRALWEDAAAHRGQIHERSLRYRSTRAIETWLARSVDALVVTSEGLRSDLTDRGVAQDRIFTVPNGVDADRFVPEACDGRLSDRLGFRGKTVIAYVGSLARFEGVRLLLDALAKLCREDDSVRGLIVGSGEAESDLRAQHAALGLGSKVMITGRVAPNEARRYYSVADVLCYPRERHRITELTTPLKPLEAMSMSKAVLGSNVGGIRELIRDGDTGLLFRAGDADDLARALRRLARDPLLRHELGDRARRHVLETRDWKRIARRYLDVYAAARDRSKSAR